MSGDLWAHQIRCHCLGNCQTHPHTCSVGSAKLFIHWIIKSTLQAITALSVDRPPGQMHTLDPPFENQPYHKDAEG